MLLNYSSSSTTHITIVYFSFPTSSNCHIEHQHQYSSTIVANMKKQKQGGVGHCKHSDRKLRKLLLHMKTAENWLFFFSEPVLN